MSSFLEKRKEMKTLSRFYEIAEFNVKGGGKKNADERRNTETKQT